MSTQESTSLSLIQRAKNHDAEAWSRLVSVYGPLIYGWCRRADLQAHDAADVTQEVFRSLHVVLNRYSSELGRFRHWLRGIVRNHLREHFRRRLRYLPIISDDAIATDELGIWGLAEPTTEEPNSDDELARIVRSTLESVRENYAGRTWQAFWRTVIEGESVHEVAECLGISRDAVRQARCRILRRLRQELVDEFPDGVVAELLRPRPERPK
ncbi:MAG: sigma-70 family RNA polymerase sigma factor [Planctomycetales bacterium]|nr:sigma-70 family RNA polymerase sigma factor [Planctomycetales bacterium]